MGKKRISYKTLSDGTRVIHYPPTEDHPDGKMVMIQEDKIAQRLLERRQHIQDGLRDLHLSHQAKVATKQEADAAHPAVPPEKRFI